jgi:Fe-S-cluster containining protein
VGDRPYNIKLMRSAMTPLVADDGSLRVKGPLPNLPVLNACSLCPGRCCRLSIKLSLRDAVHYCHTLSVPFFAGLTLVPSAHESHAFAIERDPRINPTADGWLGTVEIQLRRKEDGSCHSLLSIAGYDRCGVYAARPTACRLYPISWSSDVADGNPGMVLCPVPYGVTEGEEKQFLRDAETWIDGWTEHDAIVAEWHRTTSGVERTVEKFLEFAIPRAAAAHNLPTANILARGTPEQRLFQSMAASRSARSKP